MFERAKAVAIWGFSREGRAALDWLAQRCPDLPVTILDDRPMTDAPAGVPVLTGEAVGEALREGRFDIVIKSPGVSLYRPEIADARKKTR